MQFAEFKTLITEIGFGKNLPTAKYVVRTDGTSLGHEVDALIQRLEAAFEIGEGFNVLKFRTDEFKISFLSYPAFFDDPHPALAEAVTIDLARNKVRQQNYRENANPPILHRKEHFLPPEHPFRELFASLTTAEEEAGLYESPRTIGFKLTWEKLLSQKGLRHRGHELIREEVNGDRDTDPVRREVTIHRHKTAISVSMLSSCSVMASTSAISALSSTIKTLGSLMRVVNRAARIVRILHVLSNPKLDREVTEGTETHSAIAVVLRMNSDR